MSAVLTIDVPAPKVDRRSVVISGLQFSEMAAAGMYTVVLVLRGSGLATQATVRMANADGTHTVWAGATAPLTDAPREFRWTFTAAEKPTALTVLEVSVPTDQLDAGSEELEVVRWGLFEGAYDWNWFGGDGEVGGAARTGYHVYAWDGEAGYSPVTMNAIGQEVSEQILRENWRKLLRLLWTPGRQIALTKRWTDEFGDQHTATAMAQYSGGLKPDVGAGGTRLEFSVDLTLADPFFYDAVPQVINVPFGDQVVHEVLGDFRSRKTFIDVTGDIDSLQLSAPGNYMKLNNDSWHEAPNSGMQVSFQVDVERFKAVKRRFNGADFTQEQTWTGKITHRGLAEFFALEPGDAQVIYAGGSTSKPATVAITYYPAWL